MATSLMCLIGLSRQEHRGDGGEVRAHEGVIEFVGAGFGSGWAERGARGCRRTGEDRTDPKEMTLTKTPVATKHQSPHPSPLLLTVVEAARLLGVGRSTAYELLIAGHLESVHIGRSRRVPLAAVEEFVTTLRATSAVRHNGARRIGPAARRFGPGSVELPPGMPPCTPQGN